MRAAIADRVGVHDEWTKSGRRLAPRRARVRRGFASLWRSRASGIGDARPADIQPQTMIRKLRGEIDQLVTALAASRSDQPQAADSCDQRAREERERLGDRPTVSRAAPGAVSLDVRRTEAAARRRRVDLRGLLERNPTEARRALEALLQRPLTFAPTDTTEGRRYEIRGFAAIGPLFTTESDPNGN